MTHNVMFWTVELPSL